jgi:OmpA-OmpF porin, OOP family
MKAFPNCNLKMGGYTDNTGNAAANLKLSDSRAKTAMAALTKLGIPATSVAAEGYGQEHPIADNATAEGRAQNRRVDVRVTKK